MEEYYEEIKAREEKYIDIPKDFTYEIIAMNKSHKNKVKLQWLGETSFGKFRYEIKNNNDSPISVKIFRYLTKK